MSSFENCLLSSLTNQTTIFFNFYWVGIFFMDFTSCITIPFVSLSPCIYILALKPPLPFPSKNLEEYPKNKPNKQKRRISLWKVWCGRLSHTVYTFVHTFLIVSVLLHEPLYWFKASGFQYSPLTMSPHRDSSWTSHHSLCHGDPASLNLQVCPIHRIQ